MYVPSVTVSVKMMPVSAATAGAVKFVDSEVGFPSWMARDELCVQRYVSRSARVSMTVPDRVTGRPALTV